MKQLTKAEEAIMKILWRKSEAVIKDVVDQFKDPKPAYNTVSTVVRVLEKKGFVSHKTYGNTYLYFPKVTEKQYKRFALNNIFNTYFNKSYKNLVSFLLEEEKLDAVELQELSNLIKQLKNGKK